VLALLDAQHQRHQQDNSWDARMRDLLDRKPLTRGWTHWHDEWADLMNEKYLTGR